MFSQVPTIEINPELLRPEREQAIEAICCLAGIAIVPAIDQTDDLRSPVPGSPRMHRSIHSVLHFIEIARLSN